MFSAQRQIPVTRVLYASRHVKFIVAVEHTQEAFSVKNYFWPHRRSVASSILSPLLTQSPLGREE